VVTTNIGMDYSFVSKSTLVLCMIKIEQLALLVFLGISGCASDQITLFDRRLGLEDNREDSAPRGVTDAQQSRLQMARFFLDRGKDKTAIALYGQAAENATATSDILDIGDTLLSLGASAQAEAIFRRVIDTHSDNHRAKVGLGLVMLSREELTDGAGYFRRLIQDPKHFTLTSCQIYGAALDLKAYHKAAQKTYRRCLKFDGEHTDIQSNLSLSLMLGGAPKEAVRLSKEVVDSARPTRAHKRNHVLILALASRHKEAFQFGKVSLGTNDTIKVLQLAEKVGHIVDPEERVRLIGVMLAPSRIDSGATQS